MLVSLVRHAETVANRERLIQGQQEGALTEYGQKQAKRLAKRLQVERVDFVYTSDLKRARQTTKKIAKRHPDAIVVRDRRLREKAAGVFEGTPVGSCAAAARAAGITEREFRPEGGESWTDVEERASEFWRFLISKHASSAENLQSLCEPPSCGDEAVGGTKLPHIIIVTHSGFIQSLLSYLCHAGSLPHMDLTRASLHASLTTMCVRPPTTLRLLRSNDVAHLKGLTKSIRIPTQECALKAKPKPMKRSVATSPSSSRNTGLLDRRRPSYEEHALDDRPVPAAAALSLSLSSSPPPLASSPPPRSPELVL